MVNAAPSIVAAALVPGDDDADEEGCFGGESVGVEDLLQNDDDVAGRALCAALEATSRGRVDEIASLKDS